MLYVGPLGLVLVAALCRLDCCCIQLCLLFVVLPLKGLHLPMGVQAANAIHCWNGFAFLGSFTEVVFFVAAICSLKFSLIASAIVDVLEYVLDLQVLCRLLVMC